MLAGPAQVGLGLDAVHGIPDGPANTILVSEKNLNLVVLNNTANVEDDNSGYACGYDWDNIRWGIEQPRPDRYDTTSTQNKHATYFGSSHPASFNAVFCDGAVRTIRYNVDLSIFQKAARRDDVKVNPRTARYNFDDL